MYWPGRWPCLSQLENLMKKLIVLFVFAFSLHVWAVNFMLEAKNATAGIVQAILEHPFLREMANGTLSTSRFNYYSAQDNIYDWRYSNAMLELATKVNYVELREFLIKGADDATLHWQGPPPISMEQCPYCQAYSNYELDAVRSSVAEGLAALAPCYVVYWTVGDWLKQNSVPNNPYRDWINKNSSPHYGKNVEKLENFVNDFACNMTIPEQQKMLNAYVRSARFEWYFWNSAYKMDTWKPR